MAIKTMPKTNTVTLTRRQKRFLSSAFYHFSVGLVGLAMVYPILWMVGASFKETSDIWQNISSIWPKGERI